MSAKNHPRARDARRLARKRASREPHERILIVCEGQKTEPNYFGEIRQELRLRTADVHVTNSEFGTSPRDIVDFALNQFQRDRSFDKIFVVFDRDSHTNYHEALDLVAAKSEKIRNTQKQPVPIISIPSVPCFEIWLLLHYQDIRHSVDRAEAIRRLKIHIPHYDKGISGVYAYTKNGIAVAQARATALCGLNDPRGGVELHTNVYLLIETLRRLQQ